MWGDIGFHYIKVGDHRNLVMQFFKLGTFPTPWLIVDFPSSHDSLLPPPNATSSAMMIEVYEKIAENGEMRDVLKKVLETTARMEVCKKAPNIATRMEVYEKAPNIRHMVRELVEVEGVLFTTFFNSWITSII
jgi:hypothetical protein